MQRARLDLAAEPDFAIGPMSVRPSASEVEIGGVAHKIEPRVAQVLLALIQAEGAVVSRNDLIETCWGGIVVGDDAINRVIGRVRRIAEHADPPAFRIETIPKIGYRLIETASSPPPGPSESALPDAAKAGPKQSRFPAAHWVAAIAVIAALAVAGLVLAFLGAPPATQKAITVSAPPFVAVLPFDNLSGDPAFDYFSDGVSAEIQAALSRHLKGVRIAGRVTSFVFRGDAKQPAQVRDAIGATHVIDGTVRRDGDTVRIVAEIIDTKDGRVLWNGSYDRPMEHVLDVQALVGREVAGVLRIAAPELEPGAMAAIPPEALDLYMRAINTAPWDAAPMLEKATALAPRFARAWAALARADYGTARRQNEDEQRQTQSRGRDAAARAIALDPGLALPHAALSYLEPEWRFEARESHLRRALALGPDDPDTLVSWGDFLRRAGRMQESQRAFDKLVRIDPLSSGALNRPWQEMLASGDVDGAFDALKRAVAQQPDEVAFWMAFADLCMDRFDYSCGRRALDEFERQWPTFLATYPWSERQKQNKLAELKARLDEMRNGRPGEEALGAEAEREFDRLQHETRGQGCAADTLPHMATLGPRGLDYAWRIAETLYLERGYVGVVENCSHAVIPNAKPRLGRYSCRRPR